MLITMYTKIQGLSASLYSRAARPLRFIFTGGVAALVQLSLLHLLMMAGWTTMLANVVAFFCSAQVNFLMSFFFTWRDRQPESENARKNTFVARWLKFHSSILVTAVFNQAVFLCASFFMPTMFASALGIVLTAFVNFFALNMLVFRSRSAVTIMPSQSVISQSVPLAEIIIANEN